MTRRFTGAAAAVVVLSLLPRAGAQDTSQQDADFTGREYAPELVDPALYGESRVEGMDAVIARDLQRRQMQRPDRVVHGEWVVPSRRGTCYPHSGDHYITNKWGDTSMGIGFDNPVNVHGAFVAGQAASGVWTSGLRVIGYRNGQQVAQTEFFNDIDDHPDYFAINLTGVDRIVFESTPVVHGGGKYAVSLFDH